MYQYVESVEEKGSPGASADPGRGAGIGLRHVWGAIAARKAVVGAAIIVGLAGAAAFGALVPARYTASMQVLIDPNDLRVVERVLRTPSQMGDAHIAQVESQVRVLTSDNVLRRVVEREKLAQDPEFVGDPEDGAGFAKMLAGLFGSGSKTARTDPVLTALRALRKRVSSKRAERTYVVDIAVWSRDPDKSVHIADALAEAFVDEQAIARGDAARRVATSLAGRVKELKDAVETAEQKVEDYKRTHGIVATSGQLLDERQVGELNTQLVLARTRVAEIKARYDQIRALQRSKADPGAIAEAVQSPTITALRSQLADVLRREGELMTTLGPKHPGVAEIQSQARNIRRLVTEETGRIAASARNDLERAEANAAALAQNLDSFKRGLETTNEASVRLRELQRDVQATRSVYEAFLVRSREVTEQEQLDTANIRVISPAEPPERRSWPPRLIYLLAAGLVAGLGLGVLLAVGLLWLDRSRPTLSEEQTVSNRQTLSNQEEPAIPARNGSRPADVLASGRKPAPRPVASRELVTGQPGART